MSCCNSFFLILSLKVSWIETFSSLKLKVLRSSCSNYFFRVKCKQQQVLAVLSDLSAEISEKYIAEEVSLNAKQQGFIY